jgi:hypothetical protein
MYGEAGVFSSRDLYSLYERRNGEAGVEWEREISLHNLYILHYNFYFTFHNNQ